VHRDSEAPCELNAKDTDNSEACGNPNTRTSGRSTDRREQHTGSESKYSANRRD
jgi:hypothetical protein